ncbi:MAG: DUF1993 family protein [Sandaracinaceae bacterium]
MAELHLSTVRQMTKLLRQLDAWLEEGAAFAEARSSDADALLSARLVFDQYQLVQQIQACCDTAKFAGARLTGKDAPSHPDEEKTLDEARTRIASTLAFLDALTDDDFAGAADRVIQLPFLPEGKAVTAQSYTIEFATPNFYFHISHAYAILRSNGVPLGKRAFIGGMALVDA